VTSIRVRLDLELEACRPTPATPNVVASTPLDEILADHVNAAVEPAPDSALTPTSLPISYQAAATCDRMPSRSRVHALVVQTTLCLARILGAENLRDRWRS
jgi:hypothetical protein